MKTYRKPTIKMLKMDAQQQLQAASGGEDTQELDTYEDEYIERQNQFLSGFRSIWHDDEEED